MWSLLRCAHVTTEVEIFDKLGEELRRTAEECRQLAWNPRRGFIYDRFRTGLKEIEGCCRQLYYWRDYDGRWLKIAWFAGEVHKTAGNWLRNSPTVELRKEAHPKFGKLSEALDATLKDVEQIKTAATGRMGPILPIVLPGPHRQNRPVQVKTPGGIILPAGVSDARH